MVRIGYFVHDLSDPAVARRVTMFKSGGADVVLLGFTRRDIHGPVSNVVPFILGRTHDARLLQRTASIPLAIARCLKHSDELNGVDAFVARNLEMLSVAVGARAAIGSRAPLTYECLDIHRLLIGSRFASRRLRNLEQFLGKRASLLMTSSPGFVENYFQKQSRLQLPTIIVENKVFADPLSFSRGARPYGSAPWKIGWFGAIRCRRSLEILSSFTRKLEGKVEVIIRGRPALTEFNDFYRDIEAEPYISFAGAYRNPDDLPSIYSEVHFAWLVDYFETGFNSSWLLPNRLYEGGSQGVVPIALSTVEAGRWLARRKLGVLLAEPLEDQLVSFFSTLSSSAYDAVTSSMAQVDRSQWICEPEECSRLVARILSPRAGT